MWTLLPSSRIPLQSEKGPETFPQSTFPAPDVSRRRVGRPRNAAYFLRRRQFGATL